MPWGVVAAAVVGAYGQHQSNKAASKGANAQERGQLAAIDEQRRQYDLSRSDLSPYMDFGKSALGGLGALMGGDYSGFLNSPDYLAASQEGIGNLDKSAAARGGLFGGGQTRDLTRYNQGLASQFLNNYRNSLFQQAGMGQNAAAGLGGLGAGVADAVGSAYTNIGNARATSYGQIANNNSQYAAGVGGAFNNWYQQNKANNPGGTGWYLGNQPGRG